MRALETAEREPMVFLPPRLASAPARFQRGLGNLACVSERAVPLVSGRVPVEPPSCARGDLGIYSIPSGAIGTRCTN